ncbi:hypothetical protein [Myroides odoratus]|nr:hypothetical protein [Myroides odoratus]EHQ41560.1 hypothetical protein Myrod_0724 [Myroides odoratus DSM 2801]EKB02743.1 hypothetical protein HMPREF9716_03676 [Myroides odoratus CIP 103059]WQD58833.1 hypothetical protein U0010_06745 [Myroides odoratus]STZ28823.1 Uncharacterised protein [Myroides odoratus]
MEKFLLLLTVVLKEHGQKGTLVPFLLGFSFALLVVVYMFIKTL